jgi:hypothetical protein
MKRDRVDVRVNHSQSIKSIKPVDQKSAYLAELVKRNANNKMKINMMKISHFYDEILEDV